MQLSEETYNLLLTKFKGPDGYLFPKNIHKHIAEALERATALHGWDDGLVLAPMYLRHTAHMGVEEKCLVVARELMHVLGGSSTAVQLLDGG